MLPNQQCTNVKIKTGVSTSFSYETLEETAHNRDRSIPKLGIGDRCYIKNVIIDKNCRIGNDVIIKGGKHLANTEHQLYSIKEGIVVVKKGAVIPDGFVI